MALLRYVRCCFNPHSHIRSDLDALHSFRPFRGFNPHSHIRSDSKFSLPEIREISFNPHSHIRSDVISEIAKRGIN